MNIEPVIEKEVSQKESQILYIYIYIWNLEKYYWWTYLHGRNRDTVVEKELKDRAGER